MALIVEDGTGRPDAESYASAADFTAYHAARGNSAVPTTVLAIEQALRRATDYMAAYSARWAGRPVSTTQALDWPRYYVPAKGTQGYGPGYGGFYAYLPSDAVPVQVVNACCELAARAAVGSLAVDTGQAVKRRKVDVLETEYFEGSSRQPQFAAVEIMLAALFGGGGAGSIRVVRA